MNIPCLTQQAKTLIWVQIVGLSTFLMNTYKEMEQSKKYYIQFKKELDNAYNRKK